MAVDAPRTTDTPEVGDSARGRIWERLIDLVEPLGIRCVRSRLHETNGQPVLRCWDPDQAGRTLLVGCVPDEQEAGSPEGAHLVLRYHDDHDGPGDFIAAADRPIEAAEKITADLMCAREMADEG